MAILLLLVPASPAAADVKTLRPNLRCPVERTEQASESFIHVYQGREIRVCCESCLAELTANPEAYLDKLPPLDSLPLGRPQTPGAAMPPTSPEIAEREALAAKWLFPAGTTPRALLIDLFHLQAVSWGVAGLAVLLWALKRSKRARREALPAWLRVAASTPTCAALVCGAAVVQGVGRMAELKAHHQDALASLALAAQELQQTQIRDYVHYGTFYEFGYPPRPRRIPGPAAIKRRYYRGNDERSPLLFRGGRYLTTVFDVSLRTDDRTEARVGDVIVGRNPGLRVHFTRAPHTPAYFWSKKRMDQAYLTMEKDPFMGQAAPVRDRVGLTTLDNRHRWEAVYPLTKLPMGRESFGAIVYLCEEIWSQGRLLGGRFHYAIELKLELDAGRLLPGSDLWMNSTYRGRTFAKNGITDEEWFSDQPIPAKPGPDTADPDALGITEYEKPGDL